MSELSPTAQAVMIAATNGNTNAVNDPVYRQCIAAALRAAADQVVPEENVDEADYDCLQAKWAAQGKQETREAFLAIVTELENNNDH